MDPIPNPMSWIYYYSCFFFILSLKADAYRDRSYRSSSGYSSDAHCSFPEDWIGSWFQNDLGDVEISKHAISNMGPCSKHNNINKYLLYQERSRCFICLVIQNRHGNLLQYKQSYCMRSDHLDDVCDQITGDFSLFTLVKVDGPPIKCPFQGHYAFSYTNGSAMKSCEDPFSSIQACADKSRFNFRYRKCPEIANSYEKVESFQCIAAWNNGVDKFLYGRWTNQLRTTKESQYRCFMYNIYGPRVSMAMSADSTCHGLQQADFGMHVFTLTHNSDEWPQPRCQFPEFLTSHSDWRDIIGRKRYGISGRERVLTILDIDEQILLKGRNDYAERASLRISCIKDVDSVEHGQQKKVEIIVFVTDDCVSSYRCLRLRQRKDGVVNIQISKSSVFFTGKSSDEKCEEHLFTDTEKHLLVPMTKDGALFSKELVSKPCALPGLYKFTEPHTECHGSLNIGCINDNEIAMHSRCGDKEAADLLQCYDSWTEADRMYLIAGPLENRNTADCLVYTRTSSGLQLKADPTCTHDRVKFRRKSISFSLDTPCTSCHDTTISPPEILPPQQFTHKPPKKTTTRKNTRNNHISKGNRVYETREILPKINTADVLDNYHGGNSKTTSKYINAGGGGHATNVTYSAFVLTLSLWIAIIFHIRR